MHVLSAGQRQALLLWWEGKDAREIAEIMDTSVNAVYAHLCRAKEALSEACGRSWDSKSATSIAECGVKISAAQPSPSMEALGEEHAVEGTQSCEGEKL